MLPLEQQCILVTGAAQGLGAAVARHLAERGARLLLLDRDTASLRQVVTECPGASGIVVDLSSATDTARAIAELIDQPVHTLIHNAAVLEPQALNEQSLGDFQNTLNVGIQAGFQLTRAVWPKMVAQGSGMLVYVSSRSGIEGFANESAYCAGKHALEGFSKCMALEGATHDIASVTITPGMYMRTPMSQRNYPPELQAKWVDPSCLATAFSYLACERPMCLSGQRLDAWALSRQESAN